MDGISIIIPNYNTIKYLEENIPFVISESQSCRFPTEILIIDDGSTNKINYDGIESMNNNIKIVYTGKNKGFAGAVNYGILLSRYSYVFLLNNDIKISSNILEKLLFPFKINKMTFAVQANIASKEGKIYLNKIFPKYGIIKVVYQEVKNINELMEVDFVVAGAALFNKNKLIELGLFDEAFSPFYFEDVDVSIRAKQKNYKLYLRTDVVVFHNHPGSTIKNEYRNKWKVLHRRNYFKLNFRYCRLYKISKWYNYISTFLYAVNMMIKGDFSYIRGYFLALKEIIKVKKGKI